MARRSSKAKSAKRTPTCCTCVDGKEQLRPGVNEVTLKVKGETNLMYPIVGRHFEPWRQGAPKKVLREVAVEYDRTKLSTADLLRVKATLKHKGEVQRYMVIVDLGIPPGFNVEAGDFAEMVGAKKIQKFEIDQVGACG